MVKADGRQSVCAIAIDGWGAGPCKDAYSWDGAWTWPNGEAAQLGGIAVPSDIWVVVIQLLQ